ncbi:branched chain amino acid aminotransferase, partial [Xylophilus sp. Kf1]|nr:branched chain amino acid aminotransferase [Xylophilus sp. Kf1]
VGTLRYEDREIVINNNEPGKITQKLYDTYTGIQSGKLEDKYGWRVEVPKY